MKIVEIIPQLHMGGAERFTVDLCNEFVGMGHDVTLIVTNSVKKYGHFSKYLDGRVKLISMDKKEGADPKLFYRLPKLIRELRPDVVHTHLGAIVYTLFAPFFYKKAKYFHTIHNTAEKEATTGGRISALARKIQFKRHMSVPVTISEESHKSYEDYYGKGSEAKMICNGVPKAEAHPENAVEISHELPALINVARIMPQKNQKALVEAVEGLNKEGYGVNLYIVGPNDTPEGDEIRKMETHHTYLIGPKDNPRDYIAAGDAFILSSTYEGMPLTLIESMSVGKMAIATPVGGIKNMITPGENGILTAGTGKDDLKKGIKEFLGFTEEERERMGKNAHLHYSDYSMEKCAGNYIEMFRG